MSKYTKVEDIKDVLIELSKSGKWLERETTINIIKALGNLPTIDIVRCKDCKWSKPNKQGDYDCKCHIPIFRVPADGWCYLGERIEE